MAVDADTADVTIDGVADPPPATPAPIGDSDLPPSDQECDTAEGAPSDSDEDHRQTARDDEPTTSRRRVSAVALAATLLLLTNAGLVGLGVWLGLDVYHSHKTEQERSLYLQVGRQAAVNLTTINYAEADADVQRVLDSAIGTFHDDFQKRAPAFVDLVKKAQSKTEGSVTESGLESFSANSARVLVAVSVKTSNAAEPEQTARHWRMRIDVQKVGDSAKVSNVGFIP